MSKSIANVNIATDTFNSWVLKTNEIAYAFSTEAVTATTSGAAGSTTGNVEIVGALSANTLKATNIQGGNTSTNTILNVYGNVSVLSNSTNYEALRITGGAAVGTGLYANADEIILAGNAGGNSSFSVRSNTSWTTILSTGNTLASNLFLNASSTAITSNLAISGSTHTISGNVNVDSGVLYVDQVNNRVGVNNTAPDASLSVTGTANVSGNARVGGILTVGANAAVTGNLAVTGAANLASTLSVTGLASLLGNLNTATANASTAVNIGANVNLTTTRITVGSSTVNTYITNTTIETDGTLVVTGLSSLNGNLNTATANASSAVNVGANNTLNTTALRIGVGATNTVITSSNVYTGGALTVAGLANTGSLNTTTANASSSINVGANVNLTTTQVNVGNGSGNSILSATGLTTNGTITSGGLANVANLNTATANASTGVNVGANVNLTTTQINVGNGTGNSILSATGFTTNGTITSGGLANVANLNTATANASTEVNVGSNVKLTTTRITVGDGTTNTFITNTTIETDGTLNVAGLATTGNLNTATANASVGINVGTNVNLTTTQVNVGNGSGNSILSATGLTTNGTITSGGLANVANLNTATANATTGVNVGANANFRVILANNLFYVGNSTVNTSITSNTIYSNGILTVTGLANTGNLNTSVANVSTLNAGANVSVNTSVIKVGNSLTNTTSIFANNLLTETANASSSMNVGTIVRLIPGRITVGDGTINTFITNTAIETDGTLSVTGAAALSNTLSVTGNATFSNTVSITGKLTGGEISATSFTTLPVTGAATLANTLSVTGAATFSNTVGVTGKLTGSEVSATSFTMSSNTIAQLFSSNTNIGTDTGNPTLIYSFPAASYSSGKLLVQVKNSGNTQISEMLIAHDGTTSILTAFGTINSPAGSNLGDFSTAIISANVEIYLQQTAASSSVTVAAQLIK